MAGGTLSAAGSFRGSVTVPQGLNFVAGDVLEPSGFLSTPSNAFSTEVHVNKFYMEYYDSGEVCSLEGTVQKHFFLGLFYLFIYSFLTKSLMFQVSQFYTDLSLYDLEGKEVLRKTIKVNDPLRYGGITIYQTDWSISALQVLKDDEGPFNLAMAPLQMNGGDKKLYGTILPVGSVDSPNVKGMYAYIKPCLLV